VVITQGSPCARSHSDTKSQTCPPTLSLLVQLRNHCTFTILDQYFTVKHLTPSNLTLITVTTPHSALSTPTLLTSTMADTEGHKYEFEVMMSCSGCSGAVDRVLKRLDGEHALVKPILSHRLEKSSHLLAPEAVFGKLIANTTVPRRRQGLRGFAREQNRRCRCRAIPELRHCSADYLQDWQEGAEEQD
jgi:hypothetical protein